MSETSPRTRRGVLICIAAMAVFACMDALTTIVVKHHTPAQILMLRYWVFAVCAVAYVHRTVGIRAALAAAAPGLQFFRSILLTFEAVIMAFALGFLGLAETHALFAIFPLIATALAALVLKETIGWRRSAAVAAGFIGALLIIRPGLGVFQPAALLPLLAAGLFAAYHIVTRQVSHKDSFETSFVFMAGVGALSITPLGILEWQPPTPQGWAMLAAMAGLGIAGHLMLVKALEYAPASVLQPFNYFLLAWATVVGIAVLGETVEMMTLAGTGIIVIAGLFTMFREKTVKADTDPPVGDLPPLEIEENS